MFSVATSIFGLRSVLLPIFIQRQRKKVLTIILQEVVGVASAGIFNHFGAPAAVKILGSANIYQVGLIMACAMRLQDILNPPIDPVAPNIHDANALGILPNGHLTTDYSPVRFSFSSILIRLREKAFD